MSYCLGIMTRYGLLMASDSRTNAGFDQASIARKIHLFEQPGERVFVLLTSGSLSCAQSVITLLRRDFDDARGLASVGSFYDATRVIGEMVRHVAALDRDALERDDMKFNLNVLVGGQVRGQPPGLALIYPQGNPLAACEASPYLQIGETKYGRPILDRGVVYSRTTLAEAAKYALLSLDSTMKSNITVGPPIDLLAYERDSLRLSHFRCFDGNDPLLHRIRVGWERTLREGVRKLPEITFKPRARSGRDVPGAHW